MASRWLVWIQWIYAGWQLLRKNALAILLVSVPFHWALKRGRSIIIVGSDREYDITREDLMKSMNVDVDNIDKLKRIDLNYVLHDEVKVFYFFEQWAKVHFKGTFYIVHQNALCAYEAFKREFKTPRNIVFATERKDVAGEFVVAKKISYEEAIDIIFTRKGACHCGKAPRYTILTWLESEEISSKVWGILALLPLYMQIYNHNSLSNLLSILIIILDMNKSWLHLKYLQASFMVMKWTKLHVFNAVKNTERREIIYTFFSIFSSRWNYCDPNKKMAYYIEPGNKLLIKDFCKFRHENDIDFNCDEEGQVEVYFEREVGVKSRGYYNIDMDKANYVWRLFNTRYLGIVTKVKLFVSDRG